MDEYKLENMKMHESIVKQVYLNGTKYEIKEEDGIIEDSDQDVKSAKKKGFGFGRKDKKLLNKHKKSQ